MQSRIEELEIRISFQDDAIASLSNEVHAAFLEIARLRTEIETLKSSFDSMRSQPGDAAPEPPPPHY
jgi:SlyX protein